MKPLIEVPVAELKTALTGLGKVIPKSATLPVLQHLRVQRNAEGLVTLQATDLDCQLTYEAKARQDGPIVDWLVPFDPLNKAIKGRLERLQLVADEGLKFKLRMDLNGTVMEQSLTGLKPDEFPSPWTGFRDPAVVLDGNFREALRQAMECCSADSSRPLLHHVCLDVDDPQAHYVVGTDGRHLFSANSFAFALKQSVLLPGHRFLRWSGFMEGGNAELRRQTPAKSEWDLIQVRAGAWTFTARVTTEKFPKWKPVLPAPEKVRTTVRLPESAIEMLLSAIPQMPGGDLLNKPVLLEVTAKEFCLKARGKDQTEWSVIPVPGIPINGKPTEVTLNRDYLLKALRFGLATIHIEDALNMVEFTDQGRRMVVMPLRPDPQVTVKPKTPPPAATNNTSTAPTPAPAEPSTSTPTPPPAAEKAEAPTEERNPMPRATTPATTTNGEASAPKESDLSPMQQVIHRIDTLRDNLKGTLRDLGELLDLLKSAEKERKANDKEIEAVREKLRDLQNVRL